MGGGGIRTLIRPAAAGGHGPDSLRRTWLAARQRALHHAPPRNRLSRV
ncbi:hypothetical protein BRADI_4g23944v3 [Brachypodium distachyon]|uniref:Uncharacterized protein n=1 Tax=Brachypodium distachyon TaxID=15368 RepID=A0A0Q3ESC3_BRADI|nr:hypothetical protein BRADI_4g23944v3 [Brachypodium distachyon]